jgi:hypothetical protein
MPNPNMYFHPSTSLVKDLRIITSYTPKIAQQKRVVQNQPYEFQSGQKLTMSKT